MTRTLERLTREVEDSLNAEGIQIDVRGRRQVRLSSVVPSGDPLDVAATLAGKLGVEAWPPEGEAVAIATVLERLGEMLREMAGPEHAAGVRGVARALAETLGRGEARWWWLTREDGRGAAVVGERSAWSVWIVDPSERTPRFEA